MNEKIHIAVTVLLVLALAAFVFTALLIGAVDSIAQIRGSG